MRLRSASLTKAGRIGAKPAVDCNPIMETIMRTQIDADEAPSEITSPATLAGEVRGEALLAIEQQLLDLPAQLVRPLPAVKSAKSGLHLLAEDEIPEWDSLVDRSPQRSLFLKSWWLGATCGTAQVIGYFEGGRLIAGIPVFYTRRAGLRICGMPKLTQTWGIAMQPLPGKEVTTKSRETDILDVFAAHFARESFFVQSFHPENQNWLPFYWKGFSQTTHYTYVLDDLTPINRVWDGLSKDRRTNIRKARQFGITVSECGPEPVFQMAKAAFAAQGMKCPYQMDYLNHLYEAARAKESGICLSAIDRRGRTHAAFFFVWDGERGYNLAGGHDPLLSASGGSVLLMWNLIEFASAHTKAFDFAGSMRRKIEASFRSFGGKRVGYSRIAKLPRWVRIGLSIAGIPHP